MDQFTFYATSTARELGQKIASLLNLPLNVLHTEKFSDGELFVRYNESVRGQTLFLLARIQMPYENFFELLLAVDAARRSSVREVVIVIPYMPHSRQERRDTQRTAVSARMVADMLQLMGADRIITLDLHTNAIEGFYKIPLDPLSSLRLFAEQIKSRNLNRLCLCSPDFGGIKRMKQYKHYFPDAELVVINKERLKPNQVAHMEIIGDVAGRDIVMVDDIVDTAGTLCKAADLLISMGALSVQAFCTHGVLSGSALESIRNSSLTCLTISDSIPDTLAADKLEVVTTAPLFARAIEILMTNGSLSQLN